MAAEPPDRCAPAGSRWLVRHFALIGRLHRRGIDTRTARAAINAMFAAQASICEADDDPSPQDESTESPADLK